MGLQDGISGIVRGALADGADRAIEDLQAELFDHMPASRLAGENLEKVREQVVAGHRARGAGRPQGAQNLATRDVKAFILKVFGDPLIESARWTMLTPQALAVELSCTVAEAFDRLEDIRKDLRKYFYAPLSPVDSKGNAVVPNFALFLGGHAGPSQSNEPPWMGDPEVGKTIEGEIAQRQQDQGVSDSAPSVSHDEVSHDAPKP